MIQLAVCLLVLLLLGIEWGIYGVAACKLFRMDFRTYETGILGFFVYFGLFQIVALPFVFLQRPFHELVLLWLIVVIAVDLFVFLKGRWELAELFKSGFAGIWRSKGILLAAVVLLVVFCCWFQGTQQYMGWDAVHYIGTVDTTVYTDSMYVYNGSSGVKEQYLDFRYALSSFYMHSALLCRLTGIGGILIQKYVLGTCCILLHGCIMFALGRHLFPDGEKKALLLTGIVFFMHLGFHTSFAASDFLLIRGYEAKGFCANVVIPAVFYAILCLWKDRDRKEHWFFTFIVCFSSVPVSMSSLVIVPAMIVISVLAEWLIDRNWQILRRAFICVVPNAVYMILYFLYTRGLQIPIR